MLALPYDLKAALVDALNSYAALAKAQRIEVEQRTNRLEPK